MHRWNITQTFNHVKIRNSKSAIPKVTPSTGQRFLLPHQHHIRGGFFAIHRASISSITISQWPSLDASNKAGSPPPFMAALALASTSILPAQPLSKWGSWWSPEGNLDGNIEIQYVNICETSKTSNSNIATRIYSLLPFGIVPRSPPDAISVSPSRGQLQSRAVHDSKMMSGPMRSLITEIDQEIRIHWFAPLFPTGLEPINVKRDANFEPAGRWLI